mgnify:CR=1 FL=1
MEKTDEIMELNRETAMRLWVRDFGKASKAVDFAGREIVKGAYNDRNSNFGWNVDHILPQSQGGKTADSNLKCCHIFTNDEKADSSHVLLQTVKDLRLLKYKTTMKSKRLINSKRKK